jgi:hypothetical protein
MNHTDHSFYEHLFHMFLCCVAGEHIIHMLLCCIAGLGIGTLAVWGYQKIKQNKNHNP